MIDSVTDKHKRHDTKKSVILPNKFLFGLGQMGQRKLS